MNTAIFLTKDNRLEMAEAINLLAERQQAKVNGALVIVHQTAISSKEAQRIARPLIDKFTTTSAVESSGNFSRSHDAQIATMFARFTMLAYSRFPGAWLIIDEPCAPLVDNWSQAMQRLHGANGGKSCGLAEVDGKTLLTHGPITLQLPWQTMKMLRFATNDSWRSRARYLLMACGFRRLKPEDALFQKWSEWTKTGTFRGVLKSPESPTAMQGVNPERTTEKLEELSKDVIKLHTPDPQTPLLVTDELQELQDKMANEKQPLLDQIEKATGKRPHHFTGIDKLRQMAQDLNQPANA